METTLFKVKFVDGREYRVVALNRHQKQRFVATLRDLPAHEVDVIINGIHTVKQWEAITKLDHENN